MDYHIRVLLLLLRRHRPTVWRTSFAQTATYGNRRPCRYCRQRPSSTASHTVRLRVSPNVGRHHYVCAPTSGATTQNTKQQRRHSAHAAKKASIGAPNAHDTSSAIARVTRPTRGKLRAAPRTRTTRAVPSLGSTRRRLENDNMTDNLTAKNCTLTPPRPVQLSHRAGKGSLSHQHISARRRHHEPLRLSLIHI